MDPKGPKVDGENSQAYSYAEVLQSASRAADYMLQRGVTKGSKVLIVLPTGPGFMSTFMGCQLLGAIPVPAVPPYGLNRLDEYFAKTSNLLISSEAMGIVTCRKLLPLFKAARPAKEARNAFANLMLDIDLFKQYNDTLGHSAGDECLRLIAQAIKSKLLREHDMLARYGGEEFVVLLYDTDAKGAVRTADRVLDCVRSLALKHPASNVSALVTVSIGCATLGEKERDDPHRLIDRADKALYQAKAKGRNRACCPDLESSNASLEGR